MNREIQEVMATNRKLVLYALELIDEYNLAPRDALHADTALAVKADFIISTDLHFNKIKELTSQPL